MQNTQKMILAFSLGSVLTVHSHLVDLYAHLLGDDDASEWYQVTTRKALKDFGYEDPENVYIKQMNALTAWFMGMHFYSFTMFNIWYDEELLNQVDEAERLFIIYHEAAHLKLQHHQQILLMLGPLCFFACTVPLLHQHLFGKQTLFVRYSAYTLWWMLSGCLVNKVLLRSLLKEQEKQADMEAARVLRAIGREDVVNAYLNILDLASELEDDIDNNSYPTSRDRLGYLSL